MILEPTPVFDAYWDFAVKRQEIFFSRICNKEFPWTDDKILQKYKFTNAYRASDRVSQYLIKNVIYNDCIYSPEDLCFRVLLFKLFNKIETWEYLKSQLGDITFTSYNYDIYNKILNQKIEGGESVYSAAYIMPSGKTSFGCEKKHQNNLKLLEHMMTTGLSKKISRAKSLKEIYEVLLDYPTLGSFLAFQYAVDINYSELCDFSEMSFVIAGPGARNGIMKCFNNSKRYKFEDIIKYVANNQENEFEKRGLRFQSLFGRRLQLIDCQNLFCETDKYSRVAFPESLGSNNRTRIKQQYVNRNLKPIHYFYPPKWRINNKVEKYLKEVNCSG